MTENVKQLQGVEVFPLGEDGGAYAVLGATTEAAAREAVARWLLDSSPTELSEELTALTTASVQVGRGWYFEELPGGDAALRRASHEAASTTLTSYGVVFGVPAVPMTGRPDLLPGARRTRRRFAHEIYPHGAEHETRPLEVEVKYLLARAQGMEVWGTGWRQAGNEYLDRLHILIETRRLAFLADALLQGMAGQEAWVWAQRHAGQESGELVYERAMHYGVELDNIKPYPCGPAPRVHDHWESSGYSAGHGMGTRIEGPEEACDVCTEPLAPGVVASDE